MDSNTLKTASADRNHVEYLWRKHFCLDASPIDRVLYYQTVIASLGGAALDGGCYFTSTPKTEGIRFNRSSMDYDIYYKYFIKGTLEYIVHCYYYEDEGDEARHSHDRFLECVLVFGWI